MFNVPCIDGRTRDRLLDVNRVFRMNAFENKVHGRFHRSVILENAKSFLGPANLPSRNAPAEAAGLAQSLRFGQVCLAAPQGIFCAVGVLGVARGAIPFTNVTRSTS